MTMEFERTHSPMWIGVAIEIPEPYRSVLIRARMEARDPKAHLIPPHITLLPPARIESADLDVIRAHLRDVAADQRPFVVQLRGTASFRPVSPVVYVPLVRGVDGCAALQRGVNAGPVAQDLRFPYHPHVTIAHEISEARLDAAAEALQKFDATFPVASFQLYDHGHDGVWRSMDRFTLTVGGHL